MVSFWPRHIYRKAMNNRFILAVLLALTALSGCAGRTLPAVDPTLQPEQIIKSLSARRITTSGDSDAVFGMATIKSFLQPALTRCNADGGQLEVLNRSQVRFVARDPARSGQQLLVPLPTRLSCRASSVSFWGIDVWYAEAEFFTSSLGGGRLFTTQVQLVFISSNHLGPTGPDVANGQDEARKRIAECSAHRQAYTERLRSTPALGMKVVFGTIVDIRPPLALIQYDTLGRQMKGREQEWVQISTLSAGSECPQ